MSKIKDRIELKLTREQKNLLRTNLSKNADTIIIDPDATKNLLYGVYQISMKEKFPSRLPLTKEQQAMLKEKLNSSCEYIEVTKDMKFR